MTDQPADSGLAQPTNDDRLLGGLAHLSVFVLPFVVPLIIWLLQKDKSPWAAFQGLQSLFWALVGTGIGVLFACCYLLAFIGFVPLTFIGETAGGSGASMAAAFGSFGLIFVVLGLFMLLYLVYVGLAVFAGIQAFQGKTFVYPVVGKLAARYVPGVIDA